MKVQLANTYNPSKNYKTASWYATPKFDGVRAVFIPHNGFFTRNEKPIAGFERMAEILDDVCTQRGLLFVGGELVLKDSGFQASQSAILASEHADKPNFALSRGDYHWQHECCAYALRDDEEFSGYFDGYGSCWYAVREKAKSHWQGSRSESTLWEISFNEDTATNHGTQKPVECMRRPMLNNSEPGDIIYEPFCGSGSAIIAAESCRRICYAVELNPEYVDMSVKRFEEYTGRKAILAGTEYTFSEIAGMRSEASE